MLYAITILLVLAAHYSLTAFVPAPAGKARMIWPFAADSKPALRFLRVTAFKLPQSGGILTALLAACAGVCFVGALFALFGIYVPASMWVSLMLMAIGASLLLFLLYFGTCGIMPILIDLLLLLGMLLLHWSPGSLTG